MAGIEVKNVNSPDEVRQFAGNGHANVLQIGGHPVLYGTFEPGWRWSENLKPIAGTDSCQATHLIYCLSGRMKVVRDDGAEGEMLAPLSFSDGYDRFALLLNQPCPSVIGDETLKSVEAACVLHQSKPPELSPVVAAMR